MGRSAPVLLPAHSHRDPGVPGGEFEPRVQRPHGSLNGVGAKVTPPNVPLAPVERLGRADHYPVLPRPLDLDLPVALAVGVPPGLRAAPVLAAEAHRVLLLAADD